MIERDQACQDFFIGRFAAASNQHWNSAGDLHHFVINRDIIRGIGLDNIGAEFNRLAQRGQILGQALGVIVLVILAMMVFKPTL